MPDLFVPYLGLIALITLTPGPDMLVVLRNGLRGGSAAAWATGAGCCTGIATHAVLATAGLSAILAASSEAYTTVKLVGAAYLVWLGISAVASTIGKRRDSAQSLAELARAGRNADDFQLDRRTAFRQGLLSNLLNPKIAILFLTLLPQFVADGEPRVQTTAILAATFVVIGFIFMRLFSLAIGTIARLLERGMVGMWIERVTGALLAAIGVGVALEEG